MLALAAVCEELADLVAEARSELLMPLLLYGEGAGTAAPEDGDAQIRIGHFLPFLQRLSVFSGRVRVVVRNAVHQLAGLYAPVPPPHAISVRSIHFHAVFRHIGAARTLARAGPPLSCRS